MVTKEEELGENRTRKGEEGGEGGGAKGGGGGEGKVRKGWSWNGEHGTRQKNAHNPITDGGRK